MHGVVLLASLQRVMCPLYSQDFETGSSALPVCWSQNDNSDGDAWETTTRHFMRKVVLMLLCTLTLTEVITMII